MDTRAVVEGAGECFNARDFDALDRFVDPDMVNHAAGPQGLEGWKQVWRMILACFPDARAETHAVLVDGDEAAVHMSIVGTHEGSDMPLLAGVTPSGRRVRWEFIHLFRLYDGKIAEHRAVRDDLGLLEQVRTP
jgi:lactoylglutathione lyase